MALLGESFTGYVDGQIKIRQKSLGGTVMTTETLKAYNTQTPWIRLASSVDVEDGNPSYPGKSVKKVLEESNILEGINYSGDNLAKDFVLFGGVNTSEGGVDNMPTGVNQTKTVDKKQVAAPLKNSYGFGYNNLGRSSNRGYVPMPGIESVDFSYKNDGALAQASIKIKCFSREQFQMIDILFQRPGYTVLLEFGHTVFKDNLGKLQHAGEGEYNYSTSPFLNFYKKTKGDTNFYKLHSLISEEKEKWEGNYEGFYATISKWDWKFNQDGSYDITVNLVGLGDIISSLKMDVTPPPENITSGGSQTLNRLDVTNDLRKKEFQDIKEVIEIAEYNKAKSKRFTGRNSLPDNRYTSTFKLDKFLYTLGGDGKIYKIPVDKYKTLAITTSNNPVIANSLTSAFNLELARILQVYLNIKGEGTKQYSFGNDETKNYTSEYPRLKVDSNPNTGLISTTPLEGVLIENGMLQTHTQKTTTSEGGDEKEEHSDSIYITFATLLSILQKTSNLYSGGAPLITYDFNFDTIYSDTNYIKIYPGQFSSNPKKVLIPFTLPPFSSTNKVTPYTLPSKNSRGGTHWNNLPDINYNFFPDEKQNHGRLAYVYLNISYLSNKYKDSIDEETGSILTLDFLKEVLKDINTSLGNLNNFKVIHDKDTNKIQIISETPTTPPPETLSKFNTYGVTKTEGSFVRSISLDSELSSNYATQLSVGAQSKGYTPQSNSTTFSTYNKGLVDRIIPNKTSKGEIQTSTSTTTTSSKQETTWDDIWTTETNKVYESVYISSNWSSPTLSALKDLSSSVTTHVMGTETLLSHAPSPFFLPFNLKLTLDGLSGMKIYNSFEIDGKVLPPTYSPSEIQLIIKSLSHSVSKDGWVTNVETFSVPKFKNVDRPPQPKQPVGTGTVLRANQLLPPMSSFTNLSFTGGKPPTVNQTTGFVNPLTIINITSKQQLKGRKFEGETRPHKGIDLGAVEGTNVFSIHDGFIVGQGLLNPGGYGNVIIVNHPKTNLISLYAHLSGFAFPTQTSRKLSIPVKAGDIIGQSGGAKGKKGSGRSSGPHLHFEIKQGSTNSYGGYFSNKQIILNPEDFITP